MEPGTFTNLMLAIISALSAAAGVIINIIIIRSDRNDRAEESWHKMRNSRGKFWELSRKAYSIYQEKYPELTKDLQNLLNQAGMPVNAPGHLETGKKAWEASNAKRLTPEQIHIYRFAQSIYPPRQDGKYDQSELSILSQDDFNLLDYSRREVDNVFII